MIRFFVNSHSFYRISYDPYRNLYYKFSQSSSDMDWSKVDMALQSVFNSKDTYLSILDENFNTINEMPLSKKFDPRFIFVARDGLYIAKENRNEDKLTFGIFKGFEK